MNEIMGIFAVMMLPMIGIGVSLWLSWKYTDGE
jgi:hypothetical protein